MHFYADYEALEFENQEAIKKGIYPYYLNPTLTETSLCPIFFSVSNEKGNLIHKQNCFNQNISFLKYLNYQIKYIKNTNTFFVWFHNIQYDFRIILHELFYNNFKNILDSQTIEYIGEIPKIEDNTFCIVGENLSKYVGINIYYKGFKILLRDTMRILNSAQDKILQDFGFDNKVEVDWDSITIDNLEKNLKLIEERNIYDVISLAKAIELFKDTFFTNFNGKGSTAASMSLDALKHYFCTVRKQPLSEKEEIFREYYPKLEGTIKQLSNGCYSGGICTVNKEYAGKILKHLQMVDINSSYPYAMTFPLPYGEPEYITEFVNEGYAEYIIYVDFTMIGIPFQRCHTENKARLLLGRELIDPNKTYTRSQFPLKFAGFLCINNIDLETLKQHAKIKKLKFCKGYQYKTNTLIAEFVKPIYEARKKSKGVHKLAIKLLLNSLYGKFAQDLGGIIFLYTDINNYTKLTAIDTDTLFKPLASAVTAYARKNWIDTVYLLGNDFIYGDTDSVYFKNIKNSLRILKQSGRLHENDLGKWALDEEYGKEIKKGKFISKKNYLIELENKLKLTCVGLSHKYHDQITFENFYIGGEPFQVKKMVNIYGGKAMRETMFKIKERSI